MRRSKFIWILGTVVLVLCVPGEALAAGPRIVEGAAQALRRSALDDDVNQDPDDPAHAAYEKARAALNRERYKQAVRHFERIHERYPQSVYADDALYWHAFALYQLAVNRRGGDADDLQEAVELLERRRDRYPDAGTTREAEALTARLLAQLALQGDPGATVRTHEQAEDGDDEDLRIIALNALLQMNSRRAVPILRRILVERRDETSSELRERAVFVLSQKRTDETAEILLDVVRNDPDGEIRAQAVFWLSQVPGEEAVDVLEAILRTSEDEAVQEKAIFALSQHRSKRCARILEEYAVDASKPERLRENAIFWIGQRSSENDFEFLADLYRSLESEDLKEKVVFSVAQQRSRRNQEWLLERVRDESESVEMRKHALFWAGQQGIVDCREIGELYPTFEDREMHEQLIFVLSQRDERECVDMLIDIARNEKDIELRKNAVFWLGQMDDPRGRVVDFIEELIGR